MKIGVRNEYLHTQLDIGGEVIKNNETVLKKLLNLIKKIM